jgi:hypothetical protein
MLETSFVILSVVFLLLVVISIPLFWQMWRAAKNMAMALEELNQSLPKILNNLEDITTNISSATYMLSKEAEGLSRLGSKIRGILELGEDVEQILRTGVKFPLLKAFQTVRGVLKGVRVFIDVLSSKSGASERGKGQCQR